MNAQFEAWIDQDDARMQSTIRKYGWSIEYIGRGCCSAPDCDGGDDEGPAFAYTVGLFGLGHDELLVFGLGMHDSCGVLNTLGDRIKEGENLIAGIELTVGAWPHKVVPEEVPNPGEIVFGANRFYQRPDEVSVPVLQITYDDEKGLFPWDDGFVDVGSQPRPGTFRA